MAQLFLSLVGDRMKVRCNLHTGMHAGSAWSVVHSSHEVCVAIWLARCRFQPVQLPALLFDCNALQ